MILHTNFLFKKLSFMVAKDEQNLEMKDVNYSEIIRVRLSEGNLVGIVRSHGWSQLAPYLWDEKSRILKRNERFGQQVVDINIEQGEQKELVCRVYSNKHFPSNLLSELYLRLEYMFNSNVDYSRFLKKARSLQP